MTIQILLKKATKPARSEKKPMSVCVRLCVVCVVGVVSMFMRFCVAHLVCVSGACLCVCVYLRALGCVCVRVLSACLCVCVC